MVVLALSSCSFDVIKNWVDGDTDDNQMLNEGGLEFQDEDSDLLLALINYLRWEKVHIEVGVTSTELKINDIKDGKQPLLVDFDSFDYYFVCCYYTPPHDLEIMDYCCAEKYTWVKFERESEIREYYNEQKNVGGISIK